MAICWERMSRQLLAVLILNAVLIGLSRLMFGAGCRNRLYRLLIIAFLSTYQIQPKLRAVAGF